MTKDDWKDIVVALGVARDLSTSWWDLEFGDERVELAFAEAGVLVTEPAGLAQAKRVWAFFIGERELTGDPWLQGYACAIADGVRNSVLEPEYAGQALRAIELGSKRKLNAAGVEGDSELDDLQVCLRALKAAR